MRPADPLRLSNKGFPAMIMGVGYMNKADGYAVRCVKDRASDALSLDTAKA